MIIIHLEKVIIENTIHYRMVENSQVLKNDLFSIANYYNGNKYEPIAIITFSSMVDNGDYNYDDEYEPNYEEEFSYHRIYYSPLTGQKIAFCIEKEVDETSCYLEAQRVVNKYARRKRFSNKERNELQNAKDILYSITKNLLPIIDTCF